MWCRAETAPAGRAGGFTLLELIISIALLGLVMALVYGSFYQISAGSIRLQDELTEQQELRLLMKMITDDLQAIQFYRGLVEREGNPPSGLVADTEPGPARNEVSHVRFHAAGPARFHRLIDEAIDPGMHEVAYRVVTSELNPEVWVLTRREDFFLDDDIEEGGVTVELVPNIQTFLVEFLPVELRESEHDDDWITDWESMERPRNQPLPAAVRVTLGRVPPPGEPAIVERLEINLLPAMKVVP